MEKCRLSREFSCTSFYTCVKAYKNREQCCQVSDFCKEEQYCLTLYKTLFQLNRGVFFRIGICNIASWYNGNLQMRVFKAQKQFHTYWNTNCFRFCAGKWKLSGKSRQLTNLVLPTWEQSGQAPDTCSDICSPITKGPLQFCMFLLVFLFSNFKYGTGRPEQMGTENPAPKKNAAALLPLQAHANFVGIENDVVIPKADFSETPICSL